MNKNVVALFSGMLITMLISLHANASDIQVSQLTDTPDPAVRAGEITYSISLLNAAADTATDVALNVPLPATTTFVSVDDTDCSHDGGLPGALICNFGDITGDGLGAPVTNVNLVIRSSAATGNTIALTATGSTSSVDSNLGNDGATQNTTINDGADLTVTITDSADPIVAGDSLSYTIGISNVGPNNATNITAVNTLPAGMSYVSSSGAGWSCSESGQDLSCTRASIANGASAPDIIVNAQVIGAITGTVTDLVTVSADTGDPYPDNNTSSENTGINEGTDLSLTKIASSPVIGNGLVTFTLAPRNNGPFYAATVAVTDTLPGTIAFVSASGSGWACAHSGEPLGGTVTCTRAAYNVGATDDISVTATAPATGSFTNIATIGSVTSDPVSGNDSDSSHTTVVPDGADLSLSKTKSPDPVAQGSDMTSVIQVTNLGPQATSGVLTVTDTLAVGETYASYSGTDWFCSHLTGVVTCTYSATPLAASAAASQLSITSTATATGPLSNTATVSDVGGQPDGVSGNNSSSASVVSTGLIADLSVSKSVSTLSGNAVLEDTEDTLTYTITVTNNGPDDLVDVVDGFTDGAVFIQDNIPGFISGVVGATPGTTDVTVVDNSGGKFTCLTGSTLSCSLNDGETFANLESVEFVVSVDRPIADGALTNTVFVASLSLGDDNNGNNSATAFTNVDPIADVEVQSVVVSPNPVLAGTEATYVVTFRNNGPSTAANVSLVNTFSPPGGRSYTLVSATTTQGSCAALVGDVLTCSIGSLSRNETETLTMVVRPDWDVNNDSWILGDSVVISTDTAESNGANNSGSQTLNVDQAEVDLLVNKTDLLDPLGYTPTPTAFPGSLDNVIVYQVDINNGGPSLATGVVLLDEMTPKTGKQLTFLCDDSGSSSCAVGTSLCSNTGAVITGPSTLALSCSLPDLAATASYTRYLYFQVDSAPDSAGDTHSNVATVSSDEDDSQPTNDSESETTSVRTRADIGVTKDPSLAVVELYQPFDWNVVVNNVGPGSSDDTSLVDALPSGMELAGVPVTGQGSCTGVAGDTSLNCNLGTVLSGASVNVTVPVRVISFPGSGTLTNTATVDNLGVDDNAANDSDDGSVTIHRSSFSGSVFNDINANGTQEASDTGIAGVQLDLTGTDAYGNTVSRTVTTNANGDYSFQNLPSSDGSGYTVVETQPTGFSDGLESIGGVVQPGTDTSDSFANIIVASNTDLLDYDFAELGQASLAGFVWLDSNNDGVRDISESGISGVTITLTGVETVTSAVVNVVTTSASDGSYSFIDLRAGTYTLTETQPNIWGNGSNQLGDAGGSVGVNDFSGISIIAGTPATGYGFADIGASLSGSVYQDLSNDGINDVGEPGLPGISVQLSGTDLNGNTVSASVFTDSNGDYLFDVLPAANGAGYQLDEIQPTSYADGQDTLGSLGGVVANDSFSAIAVAAGAVGTDYLFGEGQLLGADLSGRVYVDDNGNGVFDVGEQGLPNISIQLTGIDSDTNSVDRTVVTDSNGDYIFLVVLQSDGNGYTITQTQPSDWVDGPEQLGSTGGTIGDDLFENIIITPGVNGDEYNFAELAGGSLSGRVYGDRNGDGESDALEPGIPNVTIRVSGIDVFGNAVDRTELTDGNGAYLFELLAESDADGYAIDETQPLAWADGEEQLGSLGGVVADDSFEGVAVTPGAIGTGYNFAERGSRLSGFVYNDTNNDGVFDTNEIGLPDVVVNLTAVDVDGNSVARGVVTQVDGSYEFLALPAVNASGYTITETQPADTLDGIDTIGSLGGTVGNDVFSNIPIGTTIVSGVGYNFGETLQNPASISGTVWLDENNNGSDDESAGQPGWRVELLVSRTDVSNFDDAIVLSTAITDSNGDYEFSSVPAGTYEILFRHPEGGYLYGGPQSFEPGVDIDSGSIRNLTVVAGQDVGDQDLPIDPSGIVYDSVSRVPVAGASVELSGPPGFDVATELVGGINNQIQTTDSSGLYQFLLFNTAPSGTYTLTITSPTGYVPGVSLGIPACINTPVITALPTPALVQNNAVPPELSAVVHDASNCPVTSGSFVAGEDTTQYYLSFNIDPTLPSGDVINNHVPVDPILEGALTLVKTAAKAYAVVGELVPYTLQVTNNLTIAQSNLNIEDQLPPGFRYIEGSAQVDGVALEPVVNGQQISWSNQSLAAGETRTFSLIAVIGAGINEGEHVNQAWVGSDLVGFNLSEISTAAVRVVADALFDCSDLIGTVFSDENVNGYQDEGEQGIAGVRLATARGWLITTDEHGRYHISCAANPNELRGSNFIIKVDERTLPSGFRITTENPRVVRLTQGKQGRANFGATIHRVISLEINGLVFEQGSTDLKPEFVEQLSELSLSLAETPSVLRLVYYAQDESDDQLDQFLESIQQQVEDLWQGCDCRYELLIENEIRRSTVTDVSAQTGRASR